MAKAKKVSSKTHTKKQLDDYANQNNPNNKAYHARKTNEKSIKKAKHRQFSVCDQLDWMCYSNPFDFE